jgi:UDPglucose--hexose-1-phosphate uridylyltransferase
MPDLRKDPIVGRWVIIAHERAKRPRDFRGEAQAQADRGPCPFCEGHEGQTPPEILAFREPNTAPNAPGWRVRVLPNKYPALKVEGHLNKRGQGIYDMMAGIGAHEVIVESPQHLISLTEMNDAAIGEALWVYRDRMVDLKKDPRFVQGMLFKNVGEAAGATLEHTHSQLIVTPIVPITVWEEMTGALEFYNYRGRCIYCDMIEQELDTGGRVVLETPHFVAFCPFASRFPYETWILPRTHSSHFENLTRPCADDLGVVLKRVLRQLELALNKPAYNYIIHTAPFDHADLPHYHWHVEIIPRLTKVAGFEWGTGFYINPMPPEQAAATLREAGNGTAGLDGQASARPAAEVQPHGL